MIKEYTQNKQQFTGILKMSPMKNLKTKGCMLNGKINNRFSKECKETLIGN
jgi:hypothetical protein